MPPAGFAVVARLRRGPERLVDGLLVALEATEGHLVGVDVRRVARARVPQLVAVARLNDENDFAGLAPSVGVRSIWLIFGRAIISRGELKEWMLFSRASLRKHSC